MGSSHFQHLSRARLSHVLFKDPESEIHPSIVRDSCHKEVMLEGIKMSIFFSAYPLHRNATSSKHLLKTIHHLIADEFISFQSCKLLLIPSQYGVPT